MQHNAIACDVDVSELKPAQVKEHRPESRQNERRRPHLQVVLDGVLTAGLLGHHCVDHHVGERGAQVAHGERLKT